MRAKQPLGLGGLQSLEGERRPVGSPLWTQSPRALLPSLRFGLGQTNSSLFLLQYHSGTPAGRLPSLISPGRAAQRGWGRARVPQDSWRIEPHWDSESDPGIPEVGDTGAVTVGPQIPHPVAPALVSQAEEGEGHLVPGRAGCSLGAGKRRQETCSW